MIESNCFFCDRAPADLSCTLEQPLYRLSHYAHQGVVRRFEYDNLLVPIDRCPQCAGLHAKTKRRRKTAIAVGATIGFFIGMPIPGALLFTAIAGGFIGLWTSKRHATKSYRLAKVKPLEPAALKTHPVIKDYLKLGWTMKKR